MTTQLADKPVTRCLRVMLKAYYNNDPLRDLDGRYLRLADEYLTHLNRSLNDKAVLSESQISDVLDTINYMLVSDLMDKTYHRADRFKKIALATFINTCVT